MKEDEVVRACVASGICGNRTLWHMYLNFDHKAPTTRALHSYPYSSFDPRVPSVWTPYFSTPQLFQIPFLPFFMLKYTLGVPS
jgi:hypothetical protein